MEPDIPPSASSSSSSSPGDRAGGLQGEGGRPSRGTRLGSHVGGGPGPCAAAGHLGTPVLSGEGGQREGVRGGRHSLEVRSGRVAAFGVPGPRWSWLRAGAVGGGRAELLCRAQGDVRTPGSRRARQGPELRTRRDGEVSLQAAPPRGWRCPGAALADYALAGPGGTRGEATARAARRGSRRGYQAGGPLLTAHWERLRGASANQHYFLTRGGEVGWGVERTGEGAAGGATAPEP